jgi:hypothetical protein
MDAQLRLPNELGQHTYAMQTLPSGDMLHDQLIPSGPHQGHASTSGLKWLAIVVGLLMLGAILGVVSASFVKIDSIGSAVGAAAVASTASVVASDVHDNNEQTGLDLHPTAVLRNAKYQYDRLQSGAYPPDPNLAMGPDRIVVPSNVDIATLRYPGLERVSYYSESQGDFTPVGFGGGDPYTTYDGYTQRFFHTAWGLVVITSFVNLDAPNAGVTFAAARPVDFGVLPNNAPFSVYGQFIQAVPFNAPAVGGDPHTASMTNVASIAGKIVVVQRGGGNYVSAKAAYCQANGAIGMILVDSVAELPVGFSNGLPVPPTLPNVAISQADGAALLALMASGPVSGTIGSGDSSTYYVINQFVIAVSKTSSPTLASDWLIYTWNPTNKLLMDYPKHSASNDLYLFISTQDFNESSAGSGTFIQSEINAFSKQALLSGSGGPISPVKTVVVPTANGFLWPVTLPAHLPQPDYMLPTFFLGMPFVSAGPVIPLDRIRVYWSDRVVLGLHGFRSYVDVMLPKTCYRIIGTGAAQPGGVNAQLINGGTGPIYNPILVGNEIYGIFNCHNTNSLTDTQVISHWFALNISNFLTNNSDITLSQFGSLDQSPGDSTFVGSLNVDKHGNVGMLFTIAGPNRPATLAYTGRRRSDPAGSVAYPYQTPIASIFAYSDTGAALFARWGDYSKLDISPHDGETFCGTGEYPSQQDVDNDGTTSYTWAQGVVCFQIKSSDNPNAPQPAIGVQGRVPHGTWSSGRPAKQATNPNILAFHEVPLDS